MRTRRPDRLPEAHTCALCSNESVEYHPESNGSSEACWLGVIGYEAALMNTAKLTKNDKLLRDLHVASDRFRGPEASGSATIMPTRLVRRSKKTETTST